MTKQPLQALRILVLAACIWPLQSSANAIYRAVEDEFGDGVIHSVAIQSSGDSIDSYILIRCIEPERIYVQLIATRHTMFPDDIPEGKNVMVINTKHKFDKADSAVERPWVMEYLKYETANFSGDRRQFIEDAKRSNRLSIMQTGRSDIYRFDLKGSAAALSKLETGCQL